LVDDADGDPRLTYALTTASGTVQATVTYLPGSPYKGERCFQVGYAVAETFRRQGLAVEVLRKSIDEMRLGFKSHFSKFYVEAVVGKFNVASIKVASKVMNSEPVEIVDEVSGEPALQYFLLIE
jgi:RimJ/RimL family protein N-acetyltransferase